MGGILSPLRRRTSHMRFPRTLTIATVVFAGVACGQTSDVETTDTTTTVAASTTVSIEGVQVDTDPTTTTAAPSSDLAAKLADVKLRGKVKVEIQKLWDKYDYIIAAFSPGGGSTVDDATVDKIITDACTGVDPVRDIAGLAFYAGESMKVHGHDLAMIMADTRALNTRVADLAGC